MDRKRLRHILVIFFVDLIYMKKYLYIILLVWFWSCEEKDEDILSDNSIGENVSILVHPNQTDAKLLNN